MTTPAARIISRVQTLLQDPDGVRWPAAELVGYLNDGQRHIVTLKPAANPAIVSFPLVQGVRQQIPADGLMLIDIYANSTGRKTAVRKTDRTTLEAVRPGWMAMNAASEIVHYMVDPSDDNIFYVFPPALAGTTVEMCYAQYPADVPTPTGPTSGSVTGDIALSDGYANMLVDYIMYRAHSKDAEFGGNPQIATAYLSTFNALLGAGAQAEQNT